jgi:4-aminobutyrate aminotransferase-like enzyme/Ser/Thr protein kinase RdoA (MazF antagonist)
LGQITNSPSSHALQAFVSREYGIDGDLSPLGGQGENHLVAASDGRRFILKLADGSEPADLANLECAAVEHLVRCGVDLALPRLVRTRAGGIEALVRRPDGAILRGRLLAFVPGTAWELASRPSARLFADLGRALAEVDRAFETFVHPAARRTHPWDLTAAAQHRQRIWEIPSIEHRRLAEAMFHLWAASARSRLGALPRSFIHGDANDENVLVAGDRVVGLLDFGDALENPTVSDLAIALAYAMQNEPDPLAAGGEVVRGYHAARPLAAAELEVLFPLVCGRLAVTVSVAAGRRRIDPTHPTWFVSEGRAWRLIEALAAVDPAEAGARLAAGTGIEVDADRGAPPETLLPARASRISASLSLSYRSPLKIVSGRGQYLYDRRRRPYLDLVNNVCHVGHCHPRVVEAGAQQMARLNTNTRYLYDQLTEYAGRLTAMLPDPLRVCFFVNSGSEANELALRLAREHTGRRDVVVVDGAYHGNTGTLVAMSPYKTKAKGGAGLAEPWVHVAPTPDGFRGPHRGADAAAGAAYGNAVGETVARAGAPVAAFFVESLMSCAGQIEPPGGYLEAAFQHVRAAGGVCVVDEVQTGLGRVGSHVWGFERQHVVPDIVVMGKPLGNGHPIGAVVTSREVAGSFDRGVEFFSTFGGNPVSCAIGLAVLDVVRDENLQARAVRLGGRLLEGLRSLAERHALVGDVRGAGLFIGVELVRDRQTLEPATAEADDLINRMKHRGILLSADGPFQNVLKIKPPMVLDEDDVDMVVRVLDDELA